MRKTISLWDLITRESEEDKKYLQLAAKQGFKDIWSILCWGKFRRSRLSELDGSSAVYQNSFMRWKERGESVRMVFIAFPFKNPARNRRQSPDAGELWFLGQLRRLAKVVESIYPPGVKFTVLTEGEMFAPAFGVSGEHSWTYQDGVRRLAKALGVPAEFVPLKTLAEEHTDFAAEQEKHEAQLGDVSGHPLRRAFMLDGDEERAERTLRWYLAFHGARRAFGIPERRFPEHAYISVTCKVGRLGIWHIQENCTVLPHHGVPVLHGSKKRIVSPDELSPDATPFYMDGDPDPEPYLYVL